MTKGKSAALRERENSKSMRTVGRVRFLERRKSVSKLSFRAMHGTQLHVL